MWRSAVTARASLWIQAAARNLCANQNHKVLSSKTLFLVEQSAKCQNPRFFSQVAENTPELSALSFVENGDSTQMDNSSPGNGVDDVFGDEKSDTQMDSFAPADDVELGEEEEVHEIDLEQLESLLSLLQSSADGSLESSFDDLNLTLHPEFVVKIVETPLLLGENLIRFFKWAFKNKPEFRVTSHILDALVQATCGGLVRKKNVYSLWDLVTEIGDMDTTLLHVKILNELISSFAKLGKGKAALEVFNKFGDFECVPNADTYYFTIEALCRRSFFDWGQSVCETMLDAGILPDGQKVGRIISWFCKGGKAKVAHSVYLSAKVNKHSLPHSSVNFLITSLCKEDETVILALEMLDDLTGEVRKYAVKPFSAVVKGLCWIKDVDGAKKLLLEMTVEGPPPGNAVFNSVINGYSKAGHVGEAMQLMKLMEGRGLKPDIFTYTVIISGYANGGQMEEACKILSEAKEKHPKLSPVTYHTLIRGFCKLEEFDKGLQLLGEMKDFGVQPNVNEYSKLIQSLCLQALDWETAEKLLEEMKDNRLHLNGITRSLIRAVKELQEEKKEAGNTITEA